MAGYPREALIWSGWPLQCKTREQGNPVFCDALACRCRVQGAVGVEAEGQNIADPASGGVTLGQSLLPRNVELPAAWKLKSGRRWRPRRVVGFGSRLLGGWVLLVPAAVAKAQAPLLAGSESAFGGRRPWSAPDARKGEAAVADESGTANDSGLSVREGRRKQGSLR